MSSTVTAEGGGFVVTCECDWTRYYTSRTDAAAGQFDHAKKCKGPKTKPAPKAARRAANVSWDDREGATWIDSL